MPQLPLHSSHKPTESRGPTATHQLVPLLRQQGIAVLEFPDDRAQLRNLKLETPSILFIQLLFLKQKSTANNCS